MTTKTDYTDEEWATLTRAPIVAGMAISLADPGGPIEVTKELLATLRAVTDPTTQAELVVSISQEVGAMAKERKNPAGEFKPKGPMAGQQILDEVRTAAEIVRSKAPAEEADAFRGWMMAVAQQAADAAKEGGFLGFGAEQVSAGEREMLTRLGEALGADGGERAP
jgi:hypothetical protein